MPKKTDFLRKTESAMNILLGACRRLQASQLTMLHRDGNKTPIAGVFTITDPVLLKRIEAVIAEFDKKPEN